MSTFSVLLNVHLISIALSVGLLTLRFWWRYTDSRLACARWTRIVPPVVDTVLLLSGIALMVKAHILPFTEHGTWLTEKLFGVIIYIVLGFYCARLSSGAQSAGAISRISAGAGGAVHHH